MRKAVISTGYPADTTYLNLVQHQVNTLELLARAVGAGVILEGVKDEGGGKWSSGWVTYDERTGNGVQIYYVDNTQNPASDTVEYVIEVDPTNRPSSSGASLLVQQQRVLKPSTAGSTGRPERQVLKFDRIENLTTVNKNKASTLEAHFTIEASKIATSNLDYTLNALTGTSITKLYPKAIDFNDSFKISLNGTGDDRYLLLTVPKNYRVTATINNTGGAGPTDHMWALVQRSNSGKVRITAQNITGGNANAYLNSSRLNFIVAIEKLYE